MNNNYVFVSRNLTKKACTVILFYLQCTFANYVLSINNGSRVDNHIRYEQIGSTCKCDEKRQNYCWKERLEKKTRCRIKSEVESAEKTISAKAFCGKRDH